MFEEDSLSVGVYSCFGNGLSFYNGIHYSCGVFFCAMYIMFEVHNLAICIYYVRQVI